MAGYIGMSLDHDARWYGLERGAGHVLIVAEGQITDPLSTGGMIETGCGGKGLDASRAVEKFTGDKRCARCVKWLASTGGQNDLEAARAILAERENGPGLAAIMGNHTLITLAGTSEVTADGSDAPDAPEPVPATRALTPEDVREAVATGKRANGKRRHAAAVAAERERLAAQRAKREAAREDSAPVATVGPTNLRITGTVAPVADRATLIEAERARRASLVCDGTGTAPAPGTQVLRDDHAVKVADDHSGKTSAPCPAENCGRVIAVNREGVMRRHNAPAVRESAPALFPADAATLTGKTPAEMREAVSAHYASGHAVPAEIKALRDPTVTRAAWAGQSGKGDAGSVLPCEFKGSLASKGDELGDTRLNAERTHGKCPECSAYIPLAPSKDDSAPAKLNQHNVGGVASPARKGMVSKIIDTVEHGSVPGDPDSADKRRAAETRCDRSRKVLKGATGGTVPCPDKGCGRPVELKIANRKNGVAWIIPTHTVPGESYRATGNGERRKVTPRGSGADAGKGARDHGSVDGSAYTGRENMPPVQPTTGWLATAGTGVMGATVRPGVDSEVLGKICPMCQERVDVAHRNADGTPWSRGKRRAHSRKLGGWHAAQDAARAEKREREIQEGKRLPKGAAKRARKEARVGSFAEGTVGGVVMHGGERPAVAPKVTPRGKTRAAK